MLPDIDYFPSESLQRLVSEGDVQFLLARLRKHASHVYRHSMRVAGLYEMLWSGVEVPRETTERMLRSVLLHDIGYIHMPTNESHVPHPNHTLIGADLLFAMIDEGKVDKEIVLYHHENMDGTGFLGVNWRKLSPYVRTLRIVDDFDLWTRGMYNKPAVTAAMEELYLWSGVLLDEHWLERFNRMMNTIVSNAPTQLEKLSRL